MRSLGRSLRGAVGALVLLGSGSAVGQPTAAPTGAAPAPPPATAPAPPLAAAPAPPPVTPDAAAPAPASPSSSGASLAEYHAALAQKRLDASGPLGTEQLGHIIEAAESHLSLG